MQIRAKTDVHPASRQQVVQGMSAVAPFGVDEVGVVAGHRDTLLVIRHPESRQCAGGVTKGHLLLVLGGLGERRVGPMLLGDRPGANHTEIAGDPDSDDQILTRQRFVDPRLETGAVDGLSHHERAVGVKPGDDGERGALISIGDLSAPVAAQLVADAVEHQHLAVEAVEGAQAKIAVLQQLPNSHVAVVHAVEQSAHRRGLVDLAAVAMREHRVQPTAQTTGSGLVRIKRHRGSPSSRRARDCSAHSPRGQRDRRPAINPVTRVWPGRRPFERLRTGYRGVLFLSGDYGEASMSGMGVDRRSLLAAGPLLLAAIAAGDKTGNLGEIKVAPPPEAGPDPSETFIENYQNIVFEPWGNLPPHSGEMAMLYGDFNAPGPYLVMMKWNPGWFSAPHTYATSRIMVLVNGPWFVTGGANFQPQDPPPVGPGATLSAPHAPRTT